jgi:hypothetical protein
MTALILAVKMDHVDVVRVLIAADADLNAQETIVSLISISIFVTNINV